MHDERDKRKTPVRMQVQRLYRARGIVPVPSGFCCDSLRNCSQGLPRGLYTGNWVFVGCSYGYARIGTFRARVLFVAMDRGGRGGADRESFADTQKSFRSSIENPRNPHMGGVSLILRQLLDEEDLHRISGQCALTNAVKCVQRTHEAKTHVTTRMIKECAAHLRAELKVLKPHVIITQGRHPTETVMACYPSLRSVDVYKGQAGRSTSVSVDAGGTIILGMPHPARQPGLKWKKGEIPDFWREAIQRTRREFAQMQRAG